MVLLVFSRIILRHVVVFVLLSIIWLCIHLIHRAWPCVVMTLILLHYDLIVIVELMAMYMRAASIWAFLMRMDNGRISQNATPAMNGGRTMLPKCSFFPGAFAIAPRLKLLLYVPLLA